MFCFLNSIKFRVKKGDHYFSPKFLFKIHYGGVKSIESDIIFSKDCLYDPDKNNHTNKLFGLSFGNHLENSVRFGWRSCGDQIEIMSFIHENGVFRYESIYKLGISKTNNFRINFLDGDCHFFINNEEVYHYVFDNSSIFNKWGYFLKPYFGGKMVAPKNMFIIFRNTKIN